MNKFRSPDLTPEEARDVLLGLMKLYENDDEASRERTRAYNEQKVKAWAKTWWRLDRRHAKN